MSLELEAFMAAGFNKIKVMLIVVDVVVPEERSKHVTRRFAKNHVASLFLLFRKTNKRRTNKRSNLTPHKVNNTMSKLPKRPKGRNKPRMTFQTEVRRRNFSHFFPPSFRLLCANIMPFKRSTRYHNLVLAVIAAASTPFST